MISFDQIIIDLVFVAALGILGVKIWSTSKKLFGQQRAVIYEEEEEGSEEETTETLDVAKEETVEQNSEAS